MLTDGVTIFAAANSSTGKIRHPAWGGEASFPPTIEADDRSASRLAQRDENLVLVAVISKWNICATNEYLAVYGR
jgi:hypothetical protein